MIWCSKSIEMMKDRSNRKSLRWLLQGSSKKQGHFLLGRSEESGARGYYGLK